MSDYVGDMTQHAKNGKKLAPKSRGISPINVKVKCSYLFIYLFIFTFL